MTRDPTAVAPGASVDSIETPALLLDLDAFESNCRSISGYLAERGVAWRPHAKGHRSPDIARRQAAFGAIGVTVGKVSEAEAMAENGIGSILVTTEQPTIGRWLRLAELQRTAEVIAPVDHHRQVALAGQAAASAGTTIPIVVDVDLGIHRSGVQPCEPALELARTIAATPGLRLAGVIGYEGHLLRTWPLEEKERAIGEALAGLTATVDQLRSNGFDVALVSAGGTGSYQISANVPGIGELQVGGGCFMDQLYSEDCHVEGLQFALTIRTTVASIPSEDTVTVDAGWKAMPPDRHQALPIRPDDLTLRSLSAEHGVVVRGPTAGPLEIGDTIDFLPGYHDATVFRHAAIHGIRNGVVEAVFPVLARGVYS